MAMRAFPRILLRRSNLALRSTSVGVGSRRSFGATARALHGEFEHQPPSSPDEIVRVTFISRDGSKHTIDGKVGDNLMYLAHVHQDHNPAVALEGSCEASLACSTCHVVVSEEHFDMLPEPTEDEEDMLDLATCLEPCSRLGCQIILTKELDGVEIKIPQYSLNFYVDGHVPEPH